MRDISTLTQNEIIEFLNAIEIGEFKILKFKYIKTRKTVEVKTITLWTTTDNNGKELEVKSEDLWEFKQNSFDTNYPLEREYNLLYFEFLLTKGFKENRFKP